MKKKTSLHIAQGATEELIIGEIGYTVDKKLVDSNQRDNILMKKVKGTILSDFS